MQQGLKPDLSVILRDIRVNKVNNVWSDRSFKDGRKRELSADQSTILTAVNRDLRSSLKTDRVMNF